MKKVITAISRLMSSKVSKLRKKGNVNLTWVREKILKHDTSSEMKQYSLFHKSFNYTAANELLHGLTELFIDEIYKVDLGPEAYIIDCGANIGLSVLYFKREHPDAVIVAFEPDTLNFELLQKNIESYSLNNVELHQKAVWNEDTTLHFSGIGSMSSSIAQNESQDNYEVHAVSLRSFLTRRVDFLKIDIEGAEYEVMLDIKDKLHLVDCLFLEYHSSFADSYKLAELLDIMVKAGFHYYLKEGANIYPTPFRRGPSRNPYDIQLNIFCFR